MSTHGVLEFAVVHAFMAWSGSQTEAGELSTFDDSLVTTHVQRCATFPPARLKCLSSASCWHMAGTRLPQTDAVEKMAFISRHAAVNWAGLLASKPEQSETVEWPCFSSKHAALNSDNDANPMGHTCP